MVDIDLADRRKSFIKDSLFIKVMWIASTLNTNEQTSNLRKSNLTMQATRHHLLNKTPEFPTIPCVMATWFQRQPHERVVGECNLHRSLFMLPMARSALAKLLSAAVVSCILPYRHDSVWAVTHWLCGASLHCVPTSSLQTHDLKETNVGAYIGT